MYDVCIIGGGINGVATARQCTSKGYSTILFEKKSIGCGASSKTSKLAHGGLRYLENLEFSLVKECLTERNYLLDEYSELVTPMPFIFPVYDTQSSLKIWSGLKIYDFLAKGTKMPKSRKVSIEEAKTILPWLDVTNVKSCYMYYDAVMKDRDIVYSIAEQVRNADGELYSEEEVIRVDDEGEYVSIATTKRKIRSKIVVNVTGAWNKKHTSPSKGVHLVTDKLKSKAASILINPSDNRVFFTIPYEGNTIIGTTDDPYDGDPDNVRVTSDDREYILSAVNNFCISSISSDDIIGQYVGLRPLAKSTSKDGSRDTNICAEGRVISMVGGKFTTHRAMAESVMKVVAGYM